MGRGEKSLLCDPGSELRLEGRRKKGEDSKWDGEKKKEEAVATFSDRVFFFFTPCMCCVLLLYPLFAVSQVHTGRGEGGGSCGGGDDHVDIGHVSCSPVSTHSAAVLQAS